MNSAYTVYNSKICLLKSTNAGKKKKKKQKTWSKKGERGAQTVTLLKCKPKVWPLLFKESLNFRLWYGMDYGVFPSDILTRSEGGIHTLVPATKGRAK